MASGKQSKRTALRACIEARGLERITEATFAELLIALAPISEGYLRKLLRENGIPLVPLVEGVRQDSFEALERTLLDLLYEYAEAVSAGETQRAQACRQAIIAAKEHARFALRRSDLSAEERADKDEMILWMLTWLENPGVFPAWLELRKRARGVIPVTAPGEPPQYS